MSNPIAEIEALFETDIDLFWKSKYFLQNISKSDTKIAQFIEAILCKDNFNRREQLRQFCKQLGYNLGDDYGTTIELAKFINDFLLGEKDYVMWKENGIWQAEEILDGTKYRPDAIFLIECAQDNVNYFELGE